MQRTRQSQNTPSPSAWFGRLTLDLPLDLSPAFSASSLLSQPFSAVPTSSDDVLLGNLHVTDAEDTDKDGLRSVAEPADDDPSDEDASPTAGSDSASGPASAPHENSTDRPHHAADQERERGGRISLTRSSTDDLISLSYATRHKHTLTFRGTPTRTLGPLPIPIPTPTPTSPSTSPKGASLPSSLPTSTSTLAPSSSTAPSTSPKSISLPLCASTRATSPSASPFGSRTTSLCESAAESWSFVRHEAEQRQRARDRELVLGQERARAGLELKRRGMQTTRSRLEPERKGSRRRKGLERVMLVLCCGSRLAEA